MNDRTGNPTYRTKAQIQQVALASLDDATITMIVKNTALKARTGNPQAVNTFLRVLNALGISKIDPDMQDRHELKTIMGNPTPAMIKRMRPNAAPRIVNNNDEQVG